ncbi:S8 family peptidase [Spirosoma aerolatum]|uniref:S8 family peptidase n=1 Tax=Spirosoma aerolatum TaxID=1211326 RepID=UPI0009AE58DE|nr:S8 family serine peptidase [Spirosoma aerolatum]
MILNAPQVDPQPRSVLVELKAPQTLGFGMASENSTTILSDLGIRPDPTFAPVPVKPTTEQRLEMLVQNEDNQHLIVRTDYLNAEQQAIALSHPDVVAIWSDAVVEPFACPIPPCDCSASVAKGSLSDVADFLGVSTLWAKGFRGANMVVGVVDGGITAKGRTTVTVENPANLIDNVIGGWTPDWGTTGKGWNFHGNMCATDVLGMAPDCRLYDLRIASPTVPGMLSNAISAYRWAINQHMATGTPHVLTNSWGMYQPGWAPDYVNDPAHPFSRIVVEAINEGIIVLFAAGNCGSTCPDNRCGASTGPGASIWGANGHPRVMTVGAVNKNGQFVGYSSQGPASLDPHKPDFCSVTHFKGYFTSDSGTSAATPIAAGVAALLKQAFPTLTHDGIKQALITTAHDIGPAGWDQHSGAGIISAIDAYTSLTASPVLAMADVAMVNAF